jgi:hypothetical protein
MVFFSVAHAWCCSQRDLTNDCLLSELTGNHSLFAYVCALSTTLRCSEKIDPLLTPRTKKIQDGTRAVARQFTSDILPLLAAASQQSRRKSSAASSPSSSSPSSTTAASPFFGLFPLPQPPSLMPSPPSMDAVADLTQVGDRLLTLAQRQFQRGLNTISQDLADPSRIPQRLSQQTSDLVRETLNVLAETPLNLKEPRYVVVSSTDDYEIRDYEGYFVASTTVPRKASVQVVDDGFSSSGYNDNDDDAANGSGGLAETVGDWTLNGAAFTTLASYLLGGNQESKVLEMTTPVITTMTGEMRFYLATAGDESSGDVPPEPLDPSMQGDSVGSSTGAASVEIQRLPPARLAVRRFTGFVTDGEVSRQKQALLSALALDGVELDVRHGQKVPHVVFQYNPPYTLPVVRRNEIAVPVVGASDEVEAALRDNNNPFWPDLLDGGGYGDDVEYES